MNISAAYFDRRIYFYLISRSKERLIIPRQLTPEGSNILPFVPAESTCRPQRTAWHRTSEGTLIWFLRKGQREIISLISDD
jgi:hypothetical protein